MRNRKAWQCAFLLLVTCTLLFSSGCGLVFVPYVEHYPDPITRIRVLDEEGQSIPDAKVEYGISPVQQNWFKFPGFGDFYCVEVNKDQKEEQSDWVFEPLQVTRLPSGDFVIQNESRSAYYQSFFPLPLPLGWNLYSYRYACVSVTVDQYPYRLGISYHPGDRNLLSQDISVRFDDTHCPIEAHMEPDGTVVCIFKEISKENSEQVENNEPCVSLSSETHPLFSILHSPFSIQSYE